MIDVDNYEGVDTEEDLKKLPFKNYGPPAPDSPDITAPMPTGSIQPAASLGPAPPIAGDQPYAPIEPGRPSEPALPRRPQPGDYQPAEHHGWHKFADALAIGAAAFGSPEQGRFAAHQISDVPRERAQQQYQAAASAYDTELNQGLAQRKETRERNKEESEEELRKAQAGQFERVPIRLADGSTAYVQQKDLERFLGTQDTNKTRKETGEEHNASQERIADKRAQNQRHNVRVMGDGTYEELEPGKWTRVGPAPPRTEPGNYAPIYDPDNGQFAGWVNPKSQHFIGPNEIGGAGGEGNFTPSKPGGQTQSRRDQAKVISTAADGLIKTITDHRDKVGNVQAIIESAFLGTPIADPELAGIATEIASFAALQPAMHGFRGQDALREFMKLIGGVPKDADALIASINAIKKTAGYFNPKKQSGAGGGNAPAAAGTPPKTAQEYLDKIRNKGKTP